MPAKKLFWEDPYLKETKAKITSITGNMITLDKTIFYASTGGQESDSGTIHGIRVLEAKKVLNEIFYTLESADGLKVGDDVLVSIDWEKRYNLMKLHFAAEIILELVYQKFNKPEKIGANITSEKARIDFRWEGNMSGIFPQLLKQAKELIDSDLSIISAFSDEKNERRYWQIEGFAKVSCGGTHIKKTGEIGDIALKRKGLGNNKERIEIYLQPALVKK